MNRRQTILDYIVRYKQEHSGNSPSQREIAEAVGITHKAVRNHLEKLKAEGRIQCGYGDRRALSVVAR